MDSYMLPLEKNPPIKSYLHYAFPLSILMTNPYFYRLGTQSFYSDDIPPQQHLPLRLPRTLLFGLALSAGVGFVS